MTSKYQEDKADVWKIDIWFKKQESRDDWIRSGLTDETRLAILEIKSEIASNPKYRKSIFSTDIYQAVLEKGVKDLRGFRASLQETGREL